MKILKMKLFQETACYKKPFAFKVAETYPLPPYSTVIGMLHKILQAKSGEYFDMNISIQGEYESIFSNYQNLRMYKGKDKVTDMPRNVHQLLNINLIIHVKAEDNIIDNLYKNIIDGVETFTLGRNEDIVRVDEVRILNNISEVNIVPITTSAYIPDYISDGDISGIHYRLNSKYSIKNNLRQWEKVDVTYVEGDKNETIEDTASVYIDDDNDYVFFMKEE